MIELTAPYDTPMTTTLLRNPQGDSRSNDVVMNHRRAMTGRHYSYVKRSSRERLELQFTNVQRDKLREVEEFIRAYSGEYIRYVSPEGDVWRMLLETDPAEFSILRRAAPCGAGRKESGDFTLVLIGTRVFNYGVPPDCASDLADDAIAFGNAAEAELVHNAYNDVEFDQVVVVQRIVQVAVQNDIEFDQQIEGEIGVEFLLLPPAHVADPDTIAIDNHFIAPDAVEYDPGD